MQRSQTHQSPRQQTAEAQPRPTAALESPQAESLTQLEAMATGSPQATRLANLTAMVNASPAQAAQRQTIARMQTAPATAQRAKANNTGLPDNLKQGIENLSGHALDDVKVHYNSSQPAQLQAHAYAQGRDIHLAPGQEQHLPHEAWHVVQQAQGRVKPTMQMKAGTHINDDAGLEREADVMGARAAAMGAAPAQRMEAGHAQPVQTAPVIQRVPAGPYAAATPVSNGLHWDTQATVAHTSTEDNRTVTAPGRTIAVTYKPIDGGAPSVDPHGWAWLRAKFLRLKGDWVRFHMINAKLGGPGNAALNLLPTTHTMNHDSSWRKLEDNAKDSSKLRWTYFEVTPTYDAAYPAGIPKGVDAEWGQWVGGTGWVQKGTMSQLKQGNPALLSEKYGDASTLSLGTVQNLIRSYMPARKPKKGIVKGGKKTGGTKAPPLTKISRPPIVTAAYKPATALKLLGATYFSQEDLDRAWVKFMNKIDDEAATKVWYTIQNNVYLDDEGGIPPYSLVFRKK